MIAGNNITDSALTTTYFPAPPQTASGVRESSFMNHLRQFLTKLSAQARKIQVRQNRKRLRVCETVALGDKRFVAVIQVDDQQFLLGGSSNSVSLLAQLEKPAEFANVLNARIAGVKS